MSVLYAKIGEEGSTGIVASIDWSREIFNVAGLKIGAEVGWLDSVEHINKFSTLGNLPEVKVENREGNLFINGRFLKYLDLALNPYFGISYGISNGTFIRYPNLMLGVSFAPSSDFPLYLQFEARSFTINFKGRKVEFNQFGNSIIDENHKTVPDRFWRPL